ncbi:MAG TPA: hypothetical protein VGV37_13130 [Aliidongia sp.]|uniref:hypothetical protein n=1 Tax=Aliidongia sp. TaxID=1914230 RepID=UPI002DDD7DE3|nr:hypothetical protein [Aliidongia sp.]HEV2675480.1 hypothetical protein [Aliidongia sp.]
MGHHSVMGTAGRLHSKAGAFPGDSHAKFPSKARDFAEAVTRFYEDAAERLGGMPLMILLAASAAGLAIGAFLNDYQ